MTKCNVSWIRPWNSKKTLGRNHSSPHKIGILVNNAAMLVNLL